MLIFVSLEVNNTPDNPLPSPINDVAVTFPPIATLPLWLITNASVFTPEVEDLILKLPS